MIYAVDFDNTICINNKPNIVLIDFLIKSKQEGNIIILNTCRTGERLKEAIKFCNKNGLYFTLVNENFPQVIRNFGANPRKIYADYYIDDKAINVAMFR